MKRHSSDLLFCSCPMCRYGLRRGWGDFQVKSVRRASRHKIKSLCKKAKTDPEIEFPTRFSVGYTD